MDNTKKVVLVLWDFSEESENALLHAVQLARVAGNEIMLLNIIPEPWWKTLLRKKNFDNQPHIQSIKKELDQVAQRVAKEHDFNPITLVLEGNPQKLIKELVATANINLIVANRCIVSSQGKQLESYSFLNNLTNKSFCVPFIIVNGKPLHSHYIEIVVPLDYDKKYKEVLHWIIYLSKYYKCNINLIKPYIIDEGKKKKMANNVYFTKKMLDGNKIIYGIKTAKRKNAFRDEVFKFANNIDADLILIMSDKYRMYTGGISKKEFLRVPVMCITPRVRKFQGFN